jgi:putative endonuclease
MVSLKDFNFYIGYSLDVNKRYQQHQYGEVASTRPRRPFDLVFIEGYVDEDDARRREKYFKTTAGKKTLRIMLKNTLKKYKKH